MERDIVYNFDDCGEHMLEQFHESFIEETTQYRMLLNDE